MITYLITVIMTFLIGYHILYSLLPVCYYEAISLDILLVYHHI